MPHDTDRISAPTAKRRRTHGPNIKRDTSRSPDSAASLPNQAKWFRNPSVVWFRGHDLRVEDHPALLAAAQRGGPVVPLFIWDNEDQFGRDLGQMKLWWLKRSLKELSKDLNKLGVQLYTRVGRCTVVLREFIKSTGADAVFWNRCYEPDLLQRDEKMRVELSQEGLTAESFKAELLVEPWELASSDSNPAFKTFHEYMRAWMGFPPPPHPFPCPTKLKPLQSSEVRIGEINELGLDCPRELASGLSKLWTPGSDQAKGQLEKFLRDVFPAFGETAFRRHLKGTSRLSPHIRFGELSPRRMYHATRLRVSRWHPSNDLPSPLATAFGLSLIRARSSGGTGGLVHRRARTMAKMRIGSDKSETGSNSSACSSPHVNAVDAFNQTPNGLEGRVLEPINNDDCVAQSGNPSQSQATSNDAEGSSEDSAEMPHISLSAKAFLKNLCLRDFSYHILFHHPDFNTKPIVPEFVRFPWANDEGAFEAWRYGKTGYPIVDAAMRELRATGWIHNALRFLLAGFLTKYLLLPWTRGLKEFYQLLVDGDHSANALGWQWTSGSNTDSFPFSCLVNPVKLASRQDPSGDYVRRWCPELSKLPNEFLHQPWKAPKDVLVAAGLRLGDSYPLRVVEPAEARRRAKEAMLFMKQVFAAMRPSRTFTAKPVDKLMKEWPQDNKEEEENNDAVGGRAGLFPSLWSLFDDPALICYGEAGADIGLSGSDEGVGSIENADSIEQVLLNAHAATDDKDLLEDTMQIIGNSRLGDRASSRRNSRSRQPDSRNGSGSQDAVMPTSPGMQQPTSVNVKTNGVEMPPVHPQTGTRIAPMGGMHHFPGVARPQQPAVLMPMQVNQIQAGNPIVFDPMYAAAASPNTPVSVANFSMMMGAGHTSVDAISNGVNPAELNSRSIYPQMMYGLPLQMLQAQRSGMPERDHTQNFAPQSNTAAAAAAAVAAGIPHGTRHVNISPNFTVPYGLYGNPQFDHSPFANTMNNGEINQYGPVHIAPQPPPPPPQVLSRTPQHVVPHPVYVQAAHGASDGVHISGTIFTGARTPNIAPNGRVGTARQISPMPPSVVQTAPIQEGKITNGGLSPKSKSPRIGNQGGSNVKQLSNVGTAVGNSSSPRRSRTGLRRSQSTSRAVSGGITKSGTSSRRLSGKSGDTRSPSGNRSKSGRGRRTGGRGGRTRSESRSSSMVTGKEVGNGKTEGGPGGITLSERQEILERVSLEEDHEYNNFAQFLTKTYELTRNTDRHTSKDYIRLCTLKDNYHKQCVSEKDKLKIYTIKSFFSKILQLEVTGEWDRHNHGGVRGPYVYGIRLKSSSDGRTPKTAKGSDG